PPGRQARFVLLPGGAMFSVTRKVGEQILIGPDVIVKVLQVAGGRVRLGIQAPPGSSVRRGEAAASTPAAALAAGACVQDHPDPGGATVPDPTPRPARDR